MHFSSYYGVINRLPRASCFRRVVCLSVREFVTEKRYSLGAGGILPKSFCTTVEKVEKMKFPYFSARKWGQHSISEESGRNFTKKLKNRLISESLI